MDKVKRKELQEQVKQIKTYMGIVKITNIINNKFYIAAFPNLKNKWIVIQNQLSMNMHVNSQLQKDWNELGNDSFTYEILEEKVTDDVLDVKWTLSQMEKHWLELLQPYDEKGYNKKKRTMK
jgi:hypothetical protein